MRRLRLLSVTVFPVSLRFGGQCPRLPTDYVNMAKVPHRAHDTRPCPRQKRTFTLSAAMHKHKDRPTVRRAVTGDCYAANDAKGS